MNTFDCCVQIDILTGKKHVCKKCEKNAIDTVDTDAKSKTRVLHDYMIT